MSKNDDLILKEKLHWSIFLLSLMAVFTLSVFTIFYERNFNEIWHISYIFVCGLIVGLASLFLLIIWFGGAWSNRLETRRKKREQKSQVKTKGDIIKKHCKKHGIKYTKAKPVKVKSKDFLGLPFSKGKD